jgi:hypothetical protein
VQYVRGLGDMRDWVHQPFRIMRSICGVDDDDDGPVCVIPNPGIGHCPPTVLQKNISTALGALGLVNV